MAKQTQEKAWKWFTKSVIIAAALLIACPSWAGHPLITDDAGTVGQGKFQFELAGQYDWDKEDDSGVSVKYRGGEAAATLSYGVLDNVDVVLSLPYAWGKEKNNGVTVWDEKGIMDTGLEVKWRFFEKNDLSLALKPGISIPTGDDDKGLGSGRVAGQVFFIASQEMDPFAFHVNLGYIRNENKLGELRDIWHASLAGTWEVIDNLQLVANIGIERNPDNDSSIDPAFLIGGVIYSITEYLDIDCGVKIGLTDTESDFSVLAGLTFSF